jgi:hypothetical protein
MTIGEDEIYLDNEPMILLSFFPYKAVDILTAYSVIAS